VVGFRSDRCNWEKWGAIIIREGWFCFLMVIVVILLLLIIVALGLPGAIIITITDTREGRELLGPMIGLLGVLFLLWD
jgi:hypothetical protein